MPLLEGDIRSCVSITEPDVASSDPTNLATTDPPRRRRTTSSTAASGSPPARMHPHCALRHRHGRVRRGRRTRRATRRHSSMVIVPMDTPGLPRRAQRRRSCTTTRPKGIARSSSSDVRVPVANLLGEEGAGFAHGPGAPRPGPHPPLHAHHRPVRAGAGADVRPRADARAPSASTSPTTPTSRTGSPSRRIEIDQARLLVLHAGLDDGHATATRRRASTVSAIKVVAARLQTRVARPRHAGLRAPWASRPDTPLSYLWTWGRALRFIDGPDEVHLRTIARDELKKSQARTAAAAGAAG